MEQVDIGIEVNGKPVSAFKFSAGELQVKVNVDVVRCRPVLITMTSYTSDSVIGLLLATDAIRRIEMHSNISLLMRYVPFGRQDRACVAGEAFSLKVFANLVNSQNYVRVTCLDPHSDVTPALFDRMNVSKQTTFAAGIAEEVDKQFNGLGCNTVVLIAPDAGASKKINDFAMALAEEHDNVMITVLQASKVRDVKTGKITKSEIHLPERYKEDGTGIMYLIVDDLCDAGGSFVGLGYAIIDQLKYKPNLNLFVSHAILPGNSIDKLTPIFNNIYVVNLMNKSVAEKVTLL